MDQIQPFLSSVYIIYRGQSRSGLFNYFTYLYTASYTESLNGLMKLLVRQGRGFSFEVIRAKALLTRGCRAASYPAYGEHWYHADVSHEIFSPGPDIADLTARAIVRSRWSGTRNSEER